MKVSCHHSVLYASVVIRALSFSLSGSAKQGEDLQQRVQTEFYLLKWISTQKKCDIFYTFKDFPEATIKLFRK